MRWLWIAIMGLCFISSANKVTKKDPNRPYEPRNKTEAHDGNPKPPHLTPEKDREGLAKAIAAYKAKGGKTTKIPPKARDPEAVRNAQRPDVRKLGSGPEGRARPKRAHEEVEIDELSKGTLGSYVKKSSADKATAAMALQRTADKDQTRGDVDKHLGKVMKRGRGISKAVDKLAKEDAASDWDKERRRQWKKAKTNHSYKDQPKKENVLQAPKTGPGKKAAKRLYGEDISIVDAVQEVLGLGNKWKGMEKMPKTDPNKKTSRGTDAYVTGKSKIQRLPKTVGAKGGPALSGYENKKEDVEMDEKNWIKGAIKHPGALRKSLDVPVELVDPSYHLPWRQRPTYELEYSHPLVHQETYAKHQDVLSHLLSSSSHPSLHLLSYFHIH
jgi:hypothetical protein